ncbi:MAG: YeeE/YedE family protein [Candidatus Lokiarchaeota archaeon]|nr:YeeE/YedE family protein [Candidatus Lokiarchaeota archaeon]MBD3198866.1 YeeE/YedE family protein [Candidatus Lokiarchaeota archaeon]
MEKENQNKSFLRIIRIPAFLGITIGILAALVQALLINAGGPEAYGFCVACHTRDLTNAVVNAFTGASLGIAPFSATTPVLTIVGVLIGGYIAANRKKEFRLKMGSILSYALYFFGGIAVINFALLVGACPYRLALRFGYGDLIALIGILSIAGGVAVGSILLLFYMKRRDM